MDPFVVVGVAGARVVVLRSMTVTSVSMPSEWLARSRRGTPSALNSEWEAASNPLNPLGVSGCGTTEPLA